jgi:hypothetical protein
VILVRLLLISLVALLLSCSQLDMKEARYRNNLKDYDSLAQKAGPDLKKSIEAKKKAYEEAHDKLPANEQERIKGLVALNDQAEKEIAALQSQVEEANREKAAADKQAMAAYRKKFVGTWEGGGMRLRIGDDGKVDYERKKGAVDKSLSGAKIEEFRKGSFDVSLLGVSTTFKIDQEPMEKDGVWTMTIDGVQLTRVAGPSGERPVGMFTCRVLVNDGCVDRTDTFPSDAAAIRMSYRSKDVPKRNTTYNIKWIAEDVAGAAPANTMIAQLDRELEVAEGMDYMTLWSELSRPEKGWPSGKYRVELSSDGKEVASTKFEIK